MPAGGLFTSHVSLGELVEETGWFQVGRRCYLISAEVLQSISR